MNLNSYYYVKSDESCAICLDSMSDCLAMAHTKQMNRDLHHPMHRNCIKEWFHQNQIGTCPTCRDKIDVNSVFLFTKKERVFNELKLVARDAFVGVAVSGVAAVIASAAGV